ncbi:hypothetical protein [Pseudochryseolinea flava]|uniref:DUF4410 domain-containing protein n=1 Tax=Pseudochryseolinea flava TaxID=2059302 RepID=A0A364Y2R8_9BACT|nr:hypothetical protein [Pseudochryseolinea flava]RAW01056.1 hypothetical protein DQQ10_12560 [Pseudochryseolinea flava]
MRKILLIFCLAVATTGFSQKVKLVEGSLKALKGETVITTEFTYDDMKIGKDGLTEEDYIARKKKDYDAKEVGRGDKWEKAWFADRKERFEPQFNELFEKHAKVATKGQSKYTIIFKTTRTEPGWNVGVARAAARIDGEAWVIETANPLNVIAKITVTNAPGRDAMGYDFDTGYRIQEAYAKSGKEIGKLIIAQTK